MIALQDANFATKHLSLSTALPPGSLFVSADADALSIVLSNLIGNAFKYTPDGGSVTVQVALEAAQTAIVTVEDAGIGIAPEDIQRISSGCYRAKPGKIAAGGYGVGLKVVRDLLESQHSRLEIDSALGRGSRFSFRLPLWRGPSPDAGRVVTVGRPKAL
ncbi:MAG: ATP-binding protein [Elusimicrobia bacterium]|nr:ATP-binding protein [Elusimicrobiota bacterium]